MGGGGQAAQQSGCGGAHRRSARRHSGRAARRSSTSATRARKPNSSFLPQNSGYAVKDEAREAPGEAVIVKRVNSAFIGTDLETRLRAGNITTLVICGATTNHCVETTTRMAGNLGFDASLVRDATWTFDRIGPDGDKHSAEEIHAMTLSNLNGEFARIVTAADVIASLEAMRQ